MGLLETFPKQDYISGHGVFGPVISVNDDNSVTVRDRDGVEKVVVILPDAAIRSGMKNVSFSSIALGQVIVVIGEPNDQGQIEAKFVRLMPPGVSWVPPQCPPSLCLQAM